MKRDRFKLYQDDADKKCYVVFLCFVFINCFIFMSAIGSKMVFFEESPQPSAPRWNVCFVCVEYILNRLDLTV